MNSKESCESLTKLRDKNEQVQLLLENIKSKITK